ncbi:HK97-gp10 family putative phage morphogenesis protein [Rhizobium sp. Rhizsp82]|uniref:HK97-gp10 family putative phage morphogenesis protein n=1 Tax=Rhizobium sp. Rhizsp82 TaxID=3243057 RepID=UPI0039B52718
MPTHSATHRALRRLERIPIEVRKQVMAATLKEAETLAKGIRALAPRDTGNLADSIAVTPGGQSTPSHSQPGGSYTVPENQVVITAGDDQARYAHLVEWGTSDTEAQPFFFPVLRSGRKRAEQRIRAAMKRALKGKA